MAATVAATPAAALAAAAPLAPLQLMWHPVQQRPKKRIFWQATQLAADRCLRFAFSTLV